jgi:hypothetical protein
MRLLLVLLLAVPALAQPLQEQVERILRSTPAAQRALWGIKAVDAATGRTLAAVDPGRLFRPASNAKLFTAAYALTSLGPGHTLTTRVLGTAALDRSRRWLDHSEQAVELWGSSGSLSYETSAPCLGSALGQLRDAMVSAGRPIPEDLEEAEAMVLDATDRPCSERP